MLLFGSNYQSKTDTLPILANLTLNGFLMILFKTRRIDPQGEVRHVFQVKRS